jgi:hypothetical protein
MDEKGDMKMKKKCPICGKLVTNRVSSFCSVECERRSANKLIFNNQEKEFNKMTKKTINKFGTWNDGTPMTEKDVVYGELGSNKAIKTYYEFRKEGFSHKTSLEMAKDLNKVI